ncbi:hypothetical protein PybrP1_011537 [[Pythium] brassicae (nom. inval.)]|nr:hypothetical protein PybrP1_011537 [[Pythium] brassicae (nom. inval.)]
MPLFGTGFDARFWLNRRRSGYIGAALTWSLGLSGLCVVVGAIVYPWMGLSRAGIANIAAATSICILALVAHGKAMLTNPGTVPRDALPAVLVGASRDEIARIDVKSIPLCARCRQIKPERAHHCTRCGRCVARMDHHCVWVNNCVGAGNLKFFVLFNLYALVYSVYALVLSALWWWHATHPSTRVEIALVLCLMAAGLLFGTVASTALWDQLDVLRTGMTLVEQLKAATQEGSARRASGSFYEIFGGASDEFSLTWLLPADVWFPPSLKLQIFGYVLEEELGALRRTEKAATAAVAALTESDYDGEHLSPQFTPTDTFGGRCSIERLAVDNHMADWCHKTKVL